jgi:predicted alpha-1,2-mannosidase
MRPRVVRSAAIALGLGTAWLLLAGAAFAQGPARLVDPFVGTAPGAPNFDTGGGGGNTTPAATLPFGMIALGPDTAPAFVNRPGGYSYRDHMLRGFSLRHVSGAGCSIYQDIGLMPTTERLRGSPVHANDTDLDRRHMAEISHEEEGAAPGFYRVLLDPDTKSQTAVSLTAARRAGIMRIRFPRRGPGRVLINAGASATGAIAADVAIDPATLEVTGSVTSGGFCDENNTYTLHFVARFGQGFQSFGTWNRAQLMPGSTSTADALDPGADYTNEQEGLGRKGPTAQAGAFVGFGGRTVEARVGISYVSVDNARANLDAEVGGASLAAVRGAATAAWNEALGRVGISGGKRLDVARFYTALYHAVLHPTTVSDANGQYMGMDGEVHQADGFVKYSDFSGWDVYRSQIPLLAMLFPERAADLAQSLVVDWRESGWLPGWSVGPGQTKVSPGDPAAPAIASIRALGVGSFDQQAALQAMVHGATRTGTSPNAGYVERPGLADYLTFGYVPFDINVETAAASRESGYQLVRGTAATTLEYAIADFAIASYAASRCDTGTYSDFIARSANWSRLFDGASGRIQPRYANGDFVPVGPADTLGFIEGSSEQYTWSVPHDVAGLIAGMGGPDAARARLDAHMASLNAGPKSAQAFLGNEVSLWAPWLYTWMGQPHRTQELVRRALLKLFYDPAGTKDGTGKRKGKRKDKGSAAALSPRSFPGNDDLGQMSSWYLFAALGFYPAIPGTDVLVLGSPLFRKATLQVPGGQVVIEAPAASRKRPYVRSLTLDGGAVDQPWLPFSELADGGRLEFALGADPNPWASGASPPSFPGDAPFPGC